MFLSGYVGKFLDFQMSCFNHQPDEVASLLHFQLTGADEFFADLLSGDLVGHGFCGCFFLL